LKSRSATHESIGLAGDEENAEREMRQFVGISVVLRAKAMALSPESYDAQRGRDQHHPRRR
jgi:hypothetical protein